MLWLNVWKTPANRGGLLVNSYYIDAPLGDYDSFASLASGMADFDLCYTGTNTQLICVTGTTAPFSHKWDKRGGRVWAPALGSTHGKRPVLTQMPFRFALRVAHRPFMGRPVFHYYHATVSREELSYDEKGGILWLCGLNRNAEFELRQGLGAGAIRDRLHFGVGSAEPGNPLSFVPVAFFDAVGVSAMNKAKRAQARHFNSLVDLQSKVMNLIALASSFYPVVHGWQVLDPGDFVPVEVREKTEALMSAGLALGSYFKDALEGKDGNTINDGAGLLTRYGVPGGELTGVNDFFHDEHERDEQMLAKHPPYTYAGDQYLKKEDAQYYYDVAQKWYEYFGIFGFIDYLNSANQGLKDDSRVDNYTPNFPDLEFNVGTLPPPPKPKGKLIDLDGFTGIPGVTAT